MLLQAEVYQPQHHLQQVGIRNKASEGFLANQQQTASHCPVLFCCWCPPWEYHCAVCAGRHLGDRRQGHGRRFFVFNVAKCSLQSDPVAVLGSVEPFPKVWHKYCHSPLVKIRQPPSSPIRGGCWWVPGEDVVHSSWQMARDIQQCPYNGLQGEGRSIDSCRSVSCLFNKAGADKACPFSGLFPLVVFAVHWKECPVKQPSPSRTSSQTEGSHAFTMLIHIHFAHCSQIWKQCHLTGGKKQYLYLLSGWLSGNIVLWGWGTGSSEAGEDLWSLLKPVEVPWVLSEIPGPGLGHTWWEIKYCCLFLFSMPFLSYARRLAGCLLLFC